MRKFSALPKPLPTAVATLFAAATILYSGLWMYSVRSTPVELGFDTQYVASDHSLYVKSVYPASPAERAGLQARDRIVEINSLPIRDEHSLEDVWAQHKPGDTVELTVKRGHIPVPLVVKGVFRAVVLGSKEEGLAQRLSQEIADTYPVAFLVVGLAVLFLRLEDPNAWLLALMFASFIAVPGFSNSFPGLHPPLRAFAANYRALFNNMLPSLFYCFFSVFPARSPLDRRLPWLKWAGFVFGARGERIDEALRQGPPRPLILSIVYGLIALGFVSLIGNAVSAPSPEARRKTRVIVWGTLVGVVPATLLLGAQDFLRYHPPPLLTAVVVLLLWLFPLSFAYAVVKHRVLEIPVLLRRSARYLLVQRGYLFLQFLLSATATIAFVLALTHVFETHAKAAVSFGLSAGVIFGSVLTLGGIRLHRGVERRIDRAFFRNAYDARRILEDLAEKSRTATDRQELAVLLERHLNQALQPSFLAVYLETGDGQLVAARGKVPPELGTLSATESALAELARRGRPWEISAESLSDDAKPFLLAPLQPDCLVPILGRDSRLVGLLVLGPRLSEEPYSREDKHLLASVASQAGVALESIRLGEKIAERIEAERRMAQEMDYAKQVQVRLFPQKFPSLRTLEYAGGCIQARQVGGDYYDFLELRPGRLGLVLADIAGKGISGALLMANLQANLRSQYAVALDDLPRLLKSVNQLFYENSNDSSYATLFFADYDDSSRRLRYVNCGHLPPLLLRADCGDSPLPVPTDRDSSSAGGPLHGALRPPHRSESSPGQSGHPAAVERLAPTCTVLGLFDQWECPVAEAQLVPGDTLVLYTDGVTEAANSSGEEFGEIRLVETLRAQRHLPVASLLEAIVGAVREFSPGDQADDITLVVARCRT
jgi:phosphoserine phosphatase RsbU/P